MSRTRAALSSLRWAMWLLALLAALTSLESFTEAARGVDEAVYSFALGNRSSGLTHIAKVVTDSGTSPLLYPLIGYAGIVVRRRTGRWVPGLVAVAVVAVGVWSRYELSRLVGDPRPPGQGRLVVVTGYSFPSGHAATSALVAGALAILLWSVLTDRRARVAVCVAAATWAGLVALSRVYLGVHWISDLVGSWLLAGVWLVVLHTVVEWAAARTATGEAAATIPPGPAAEAPAEAPPARDPIRHGPDSA